MPMPPMPRQSWKTVSYLTNYDERTLAFAKDYSNQLLAIDVNLDTTEMLDVAWGLFGKYFRPEEVNMKKELVEQYWPK